MSITIVSTLITAIKTEVETAISYSELNKVIDIEGLGKRFTSERYGVIAGPASQVEGATRYITMDQEFIISLTKDYVNTNVSDAGKRTVTNTLMNNAYDVYKALVNNKAGSPANVMNVKDLTLDEPVYFENEDTVLINMNFILTYRIAL